MIQINMNAGAVVVDETATGFMTSAGNPWSITSDAMAEELVHRGVATFVGFNPSSEPPDSITGTAYTLTNADNGKLKTALNPAATTVTIPGGLDPGFGCFIRQGGSGQVTIAAGAGVTFTALSGSQRKITGPGLNAWVTLCNFSGGVDAYDLTGNLTS